jgi:hypothetical protein
MSDTKCSIILTKSKCKRHIMGFIQPQGQSVHCICSYSGQNSQSWEDLSGIGLGPIVAQKWQEGGANIHITSTFYRKVLACFLRTGF